jgi:hypothetical protein
MRYRLDLGAGNITEWRSAEEGGNACAAGHMQEVYPPSPTITTREASCLDASVAALWGCFSRAALLRQHHFHGPVSASLCFRAQVRGCPRLPKLATLRAPRLLVRASPDLSFHAERGFGFGELMQEAVAVRRVNAVCEHLTAYDFLSVPEHTKKR